MVKKKTVQDDKNSVCHASYLWNYIVIYGIHVQNDNISRCFFQFFRISIFQVVRWLKGQKMVQNDKKFCLLHFISHELYIMWLSFIVCIRKIIISSGVLLIFPKFWFSGSIGRWNSKKRSRMTKNSVCYAPYLRNHTSCDCHFWCKCVKLWYLQIFFSILKFWFSRLPGCWKCKKWPKMTKNSACLTPNLRNHTSYDCGFWYTCKMMISPANFFIFQNFDFGVFMG